MIDGFESYSEPLATRARFFQRLLGHLVASAALIGLSLALGMAGYHWIAGQGWIDAFLNACMLLGGMGPVGELTGNGAKIFAGLYALYCGIVLIAVAGILLAPIMHRVLHRLHLDDPD